MNRKAHSPDSIHMMMIGKPFFDQAFEICRFLFKFVPILVLNCMPIVFAVTTSYNFYERSTEFPLVLPFHIPFLPPTTWATYLVNYLNQFIAMFYMAVYMTTCVVILIVIGSYGYFYYDVICEIIRKKEELMQDVDFIGWLDLFMDLFLEHRR